MQPLQPDEFIENQYPDENPQETDIIYVFTEVINSYSFVVVICIKQNYCFFKNGPCYLRNILTETENF